jgi:antitoxin (DNA-binding transcriptional repressor) of toxin-antitoxin stability system
MRIAKEQLPKLAREASLGVRVTITVHGRPVADLVPHVAEPEAPKRTRVLPVRVSLAPGAAIADLLEDLRSDR